MGDGQESALIAVRAQDIQTGLQHHSVDHFDLLPLVGMAARLAIHIRGRDAIEVELLKRVGAVFFGIPQYAFKAVTDVLQEIGFITVIGNRVVPSVPYFTDLYGTLSDYATTTGLNEIEQASVAILERLAHGPILKTSLVEEFGLDERAGGLVLSIGQAGAYVGLAGTKDSEVLYSPVYFSENPTALSEAATNYGSELVMVTLEAIRKNQGWPLRSIIERQRIGDIRIRSEQSTLVQGLVQKGVLQPPAVTTSTTGVNQFVFTPPAGTERIPVLEKETYERALALVSAVRQGQHFARYRIRSPFLVLKALRRDGYLRGTSEAREQWRVVGQLRICRLERTAGNRYEVHLIRAEENRRALDLAIDLLRSEEVLEGRGHSHEVDQILEGGILYEESLLALAQHRSKLIVPEARRDLMDKVDQLIASVEML